MKKLFLVAFIALAAVGVAFGTETLNIAGTVPDQISIALVQDGLALDFVGLGEAGTQDGTATLTVVSNKKTWTVTISSGTDGFMLTKADTNSIPYKVQAALDADNTESFNGTILNGLADPTHIASGNVTIKATANGRTSKLGIDFSFTISADAQGDTTVLWEAGAYTDTITITIAAG